MRLRALILNCTLKNSTETSNTEAFINHAEKIFHELDVETEILRVAEYHIDFGNTSGEGGDEHWSLLLEKIKACDIFIMATPVWRGGRGPVVKLVAERMDGLTSEGDGINGQSPTYRKVCGAMVNGDEQGAKKAIASIYSDLSSQGFTVPVNAFSYWVDDVGSGRGYSEAQAEKHFFTNSMLHLMVHNLVQVANVLRELPYPTGPGEMEQKAKAISR